MLNHVHVYVKRRFKRLKFNCRAKKAAINKMGMYKFAYKAGTHEYLANTEHGLDKKTPRR